MLGRSIFIGGLGVLLTAATVLAQPGGFPGGPPGGFPGGPMGPPQPGQVLPTFLQDQLKLTAAQKTTVVELQKEVDTKLDKLFTNDQKKQWKELKDNPFRGFGGPGGPGGRGPGGPGGPGGRGPGGPMQMGQILPDFLQDQLKLTDDQKKQVAQVQKEVDTKLDKLFTDEQKKQWKELKDNPFRAFGGGFGGPGGPGGRGPGGFGGGFGAVRLDDVKKRLDATDEEWKVIGPKLQKVMTSRQIVTGESRGPDFGGGFGGTSGNIISQAQAELKAVLDDPKHSKTEVEEKVAAVRKARQKARADLEAAQTDLLQMLTATQEAVLVSLGYLD